MGLSQRMLAALLVALAIGLVGTSCTPAVPGASTLFGPPTYPDPGNGRLSKRQILRITNKVARRNGFHLSDCGIQYDEGNEYWRERNPRPPAELEGCDYQAVWYRHWPMVFGGELAVLVDRDTGQVLMELLLQ